MWLRQGAIIKHIFSHNILTESRLFQVFPDHIKSDFSRFFKFPDHLRTHASSRVSRLLRTILHLREFLLRQGVFLGIFSKRKDSIITFQIKFNSLLLIIYLILIWHDKLFTYVHKRFLTQKSSTAYIKNWLIPKYRKQVFFLAIYEVKSKENRFKDFRA